MKPVVAVPYAIATAVAQGAAQLAARLAPSSPHKVVRSLRARAGLTARLVARARAVRDPARPLIWLHAPSVGEGLQARPVAQALRAAHPEWQQGYTFFSPSAEAFASTVGAEICDYLPFDRAHDADALLEAIRPSALVFAKLDVWPVLVARAHARGIPVALISATLAEQSGRRGWWSQQLVGPAYQALQAVGAIDAAHASRLQALGVPKAVLQVTGDTRFDQVWERAQRVDRESALLRMLASDRPTLVAGSTWPSDEAPLLQRLDPSLRLILAPHEPTAAHCDAIARWARETGRTLSRLSTLTEDTARAADVVLVDRMGILGDLYALADIAFVGGGFHAAGLHSTIEPAAFGVPVLFGPRYQGSREAGLLIAAGGAQSVADATALQAALSHWFTHPAARQAAGLAAQTVVRQELGATARSVALIEALVPRG